MSSHETYTVPTRDGRDVEALASGPPEGFPLVFHHWTPGAAVPFGILERAATQRGLRVLSYSRPGCGLSTPRPEHNRTATVAMPRPIPRAFSTIWASLSSSASGGLEADHVLWPALL
jgi:pimeloyl-ACP methyl ester carboxylesterase